MEESNTSNYRKIHYENLILDKENPRLPKSKRVDGISESDIIQYMLLQAATLELMIAIGENGFFAGEQLLVVRGENDKYIVVEGNRRLTAVKLLHKPELATVKKATIEKIISEVDTTKLDEMIPCLIFESKDTVLRYLGFRHVTGIKPWKMLQKARYMYQLRNDNFPDERFQDACRSIAKMIGSRQDYVKKVLVGFELYRIIEDDAFYGIKGLDDNNFHFNYLKDSLSYSNIQDFWGVSFEDENPATNVNHANLKESIHWFFEKNIENKSRVLGDSKGRTILNAVIGNEKALAEFRSGASIEKAYEMTADLEVFFETNVKKSLLRLEDADGTAHRINNFYPDFDDDINSIRKLAMKIKNLKTSLEDEN